MRCFAFSLCFLIATVARADAPKVVTDIAPIHSLAAQVMDGVGAPELILPPGMSPHGYAMRPSEARALAQSDLVIWVGPSLTPWMEEAVHNLSNDAQILTLMNAPETQLLEAREGVAFHDDHDGHAGHGDHDDHAEEGKHKDHDDHGHDHDHAGGMDPHVWLDPENAARWLSLIADALALQDSENAQTYRDNAKSAQSRLGALQAELTQELKPAKGANFVVFHDAYQYFENHFDLHAAAAVSLGDAIRPGPKRLAALRDLVIERDINCLLTEPQFDHGLIDVIAPEGAATDVLDPLGAKHRPGPSLYSSVLRDMARAFASCAGQS